VKIGGISIILIFGIINLVLLFFQLGTGKQWIKVHFTTHKKSGVALLISAVIHGLLAIFSA